MVQGTVIKEELGSAALMAEQALGNEDNMETIETRFGDAKIDRSKAIFFPRGLLGLAPELSFCMADFPKEGYGEIRLLQCLNDESLAFMVLPVGLDNPYMDVEHVQDACTQLEIDAQNMLGLVILSVSRTPDSMNITGNMRAPLLVDVKQKRGAQFVFTNNKYEIAHKLI